ncbi:hypothetical protein Sjap_016789 [Stephania japonica]|uniref:EF-hand domain-containing protein n=1 Tax=Stephania japonica TaxID=461633 RepID=A0AAP0NJ20_9MAGN
MESSSDDHHMMNKAGKKSEVVGGNKVLDGSDIMELVGNEEVFSTFVDHKFQELDLDKDGKLSVKELQPAVADIGTALGLPAQGSSPDSDHIYSEAVMGECASQKVGGANFSKRVLNEFTHGKQGNVSKKEFQVVLSDILIGMATGLKRDPVVILRMDGEDLLEFINGPSFESDAMTIFSQVESTEKGSIRDCMKKALTLLTVDHGMPPTDSWVTSNVIEPILQSCPESALEQPFSQDVFLNKFKQIVERVVHKLQEQPVIVAHSEQTFDGSGIKRLLSNKFELDKTLDGAVKDVPRDKNGKLFKEYLRVALDLVAPAAGLPPIGAVDQMDKIVNEVLRMIEADDGKMVDEEEFKKLMREVLGSIMLQLEGSAINVSSNSVIHEPLATSSTLLTPTPTTTS